MTANCELQIPISFRNLQIFKHGLCSHTHTHTLSCTETTLAEWRI